MKISEILDTAADKIAAPGAWIKGAEAMDCRGITVDPRSPDACRMCWKGAMMAADPDYSIPAWFAHLFANENLSVCLEKLGFPKHVAVTVTSFNDHPETSQEMVVAASRCLADMARAAGR